MSIEIALLVLMLEPPIAAAWRPVDALAPALTINHVFFREMYSESNEHPYESTVARADNSMNKTRSGGEVLRERISAIKRVADKSGKGYKVIVTPGNPLSIFIWDPRAPERSAYIDDIRIIGEKEIFQAGYADFRALADRGLYQAIMRQIADVLPPGAVYRTVISNEPALDSLLAREDWTSIQEALTRTQFGRVFMRAGFGDLDVVYVREHKRSARGVQALKRLRRERARGDYSGELMLIAKKTSPAQQMEADVGLIYGMSPTHDGMLEWLEGISDRLGAMPLLVFDYHVDIDTTGAPDAGWLRQVRKTGRTRPIYVIRPKWDFIGISDEMAELAAYLNIHIITDVARLPLANKSAIVSFEDDYFFDTSRPGKVSERSLAKELGLIKAALAKKKITVRALHVTPDPATGSSLSRNIITKILTLFSSPEAGRQSGHNDKSVSRLIDQAI